MSNNGESLTEPEDPLLKLTFDPTWVVLHSGMKGFWQGYYCCQAQLLRHLRDSNPELSEEERAALVTRAVQAAVMAAQQKPPTAAELHATLRDLCLPILKELGVAEAELEDLKDEDEEYDASI